jgi:hypothetical protein
VHTQSLSSRRNRQLLAAIVAFALVSAFVIRTSDAAFNATASNTGNEFSTGTITLEANHSVPMFGDGDPASIIDATGLKPGDVVEACTEIEYIDTLQNTNLEAVTLASVVGTPGGLADHLGVELARTDDCLTAPDAGAYGSFTLGEEAAPTGWTPSGTGDTQGFHFRVTVADTAPQGASASGIDFTWSVTTN